MILSCKGEKKVYIMRNVRVCVCVCKYTNVYYYYNSSVVGFLAIQQLNLEKLLNSSYSSSTSETAKSYSAGEIPHLGT